MIESVGRGGLPIAYQIIYPTIMQTWIPKDQKKDLHTKVFDFLKFQDLGRKFEWSPNWYLCALRIFSWHLFWCLINFPMISQCIISSLLVRPEIMGIEHQAAELPTHISSPIRIHVLVPLSSIYYLHRTWIRYRLARLLFKLTTLDFTGPH